METVRNFVRSEFPDFQNVDFDLGYMDNDCLFVMIKNSEELVEAHRRHQAHPLYTGSLFTLHAKTPGNGSLELINQNLRSSLGSPHSALPMPSTKPSGSEPNANDEEQKLSVATEGKKKGRKRKRKSYRKSSPNTRQALDIFRPNFESALKSSSEEGLCPACRTVILSASNKKYWKTCWVRHLLNSCPSFPNDAVTEHRTSPVS